MGRRMVNRHVDFGNNHNTSAPAADLKVILAEQEISFPALPHIGLEAEAARLLEQRRIAVTEELKANLKALEEATQSGLTANQLTEPFEKLETETYVDEQKIVADLIVDIKHAKNKLAQLNQKGDIDYEEIDLLLEYFVCREKQYLDAHPQPQFEFKEDDSAEERQAKREAQNTIFRERIFDYLEEIQALIPGAKGGIGTDADKLSDIRQHIFISQTYNLCHFSATEQFLKEIKTKTREHFQNRFSGLINDYNSKQPAVDKEVALYNQKVGLYNENVSKTTHEVQGSAAGETLKTYNHKVKDYNDNPLHKVKKREKIDPPSKFDANDLLDSSDQLNLEDHEAVTLWISRIKGMERLVKHSSDTKTTTLLLQQLIIKRKRIFDLTHRINKGDTSFTKQQKIKKFNAAFKKEMNEHLNAIQKRLTKKGIRIKHPEKFRACVNYLTDISKNAAEMTGEFDNAKQEMVDQINTALSALDQAAEPEKYGSKFEKLKGQLKEKITAYGAENDSTDARVEALEWATKHTFLEKVQELNPTPDNEAELNESLTLRPDHYDTEKEPIAPKISDMKLLVNKMAVAKAKQQKLQATLDRANTNKNSPEGQLKTLRERQKSYLDNIKHRLNATQNPNPDSLKTFQQELNGVNSQYRSDIKNIHQNTGTAKLLDSVSAPLNALRGNQLTRSIQLPQLDVDIHDSENRGLIGLHNETQEINELLQKREDMEATLASTPNLANTMREEILENTNTLSQKMAALAETMQSMHSDKSGTMPSLLASIPNIEEFSHKAAALHDALNRKKFSQRHNVHGLLKFCPILNSLSNGYKLPIPKVKHNATARGKDNYTSNYFELDEKSGQWLSKELRLQGNFLTDDKGNSLKDKNGKEIPLSEEDKVVKFTGKELANLYAEFCKERQLNKMNGNAPKMKSLGSNRFRIRWPNKQLRDDWMKFLSSRYTQKLIEKANNLDPECKHEAKVGIKDEDSGIGARMLPKTC